MNDTTAPCNVNTFLLNTPKKRLHDSSKNNYNPLACLREVKEVFIMIKHMYLNLQLKHKMHKDMNFNVKRKQIVLSSLAI